jgi:hypothetical protein
MHRCSALLALALTLGACTESGSRSTSNKNDPGDIDPETMRQYSRNLQQYIDALLLCGSTSALDWEEAKRQFELLQPFLVFQEDPSLIRQFRAGSEVARVELARRGVVLRSALVFGGPYDRAKWDEARKILMDSGEGGQVLLSTTLLKSLLNVQLQANWMHVRFALVESGNIALETTVGLAKELVNSTPADTAVFRMEGLVQVLMVIIGFGDAGRPHLEEFSRSAKPNIRRIVARAIGESMDGASVAILTRQLLDSDWTVRTAAAEAMGHMASARSTAGPALADRVGKEHDGLVLRTVLRAIGDLLYADAIPELIRVLEVPSRDTAEAAMQALYIITGEKFLRREQWVEWFRTKYPEWKKKRAASR